MKEVRKLSVEQQQQLTEVLKTRFEKNMQRHQELNWSDVETKLQSSPEKFWSLYQMEISGGEPDIVGYDTKTKEYIFFDCAAESPAKRRSFAYDYQGQHSRKEHIPQNNAIDAAKEMGIELMTEAHYRNLQQLGNFDTKTSSWLKTPEEIRTLGGAIFGDFRYNTVFIYHNGAQSYYAARGFRGVLRV